LTKGLLHTLGVAWNRYPSIRQYLPRKERHCRTATFILLRFEIWLNLVPSFTVRWHCGNEETSKHFATGVNCKG
jgi:hypothetical protein